MPDLSREAQERARRTIEVAEIFAAHAEEISEAVVDVPEGSVVVAVVGADHEFEGTHLVSNDDLLDRVTELEGPGGWAMVFSPGADASSVRRRTADMADIAAQRVDAIDRIHAKRGSS